MTALPEHAGAGDDAGMSDTCTAKGPGWKCDRDIQAKGLCPGHYQQRRRGRELAPLDGPSGQLNDAKLVQVTLHVPPEWDDAIQAEARQRNESAAETYRRGLAPFVSRIRRGK